MIPAPCPTCGHVDYSAAPLLTIGGKAYEIVKHTEIKKRYIFVNDNEVLYCPPIPVLIVKEKG